MPSVSVSPTPTLALEHIDALSPVELLAMLRGSDTHRRAVELGRVLPLGLPDHAYEDSAHWSREAVFADALWGDVELMRTHVEGFAEVLKEVERIPVDVVHKALAMILFVHIGPRRSWFGRRLHMPTEVEVAEAASRLVRRRLVRRISRISRRWLSAVASVSDGEDVHDALERRATPLAFSDWLAAGEKRLTVREVPVEGAGRRFVILEAGARTESDVDLMGVDRATAVQVLFGQVPEGWEVVVGWEDR